MLGSFHTIKIALSCVGKYIRSSGLENVFTDTEMYGVGTVKQVLDGTHYGRSVNGFMLLEEALQRLQLEARWGAVYYNDIVMLQHTAPEVYEKFMEGRFTVKERNIPFTSKGTVQALEQTINKSSKNTGAVSYFNLKHVNPFGNDKQVLKNIVTNEIAPLEVTEALLQVFQTGCTLFNDFQAKRFHYDPKTSLSARIK
ncbi:hypothetical protein KQX54_012921 [Cotesia glomerata]|uniref:Uncharacterized protein n=1 Tax=Cotesia glomerata TaxID=32391 RepID=A0AAV7HXV6_COTGL|nr:hypothetical protein KQX54_012921 [Cotesia glomerata]